MSHLRVTVAQLPVYAGDLEGNRERILAAAECAVAVEADVLLTPETYLSGYPCDDLLGDPDFIDGIRDELANLANLLPENLLVAVGTPLWIPDLPPYVQATLDHHGLDAEPRRLVNGLVLFQYGREIGYVVKHLLPTYGVFDDARWFASGPEHGPIFDVAGVKVGFAICEDVWATHVADGLDAAGAEVILVANASPYSEGKQDRRIALMERQVARTEVPVVYANMVGGQDEVVYDGASFALDADGTDLAQFPMFFERTASIDIPVKPRTGRTSWPRSTVNTPMVEPLEKNAATWMALQVALRDYITRSGSNGVIIGLSGGLDSALAATLAVDSLAGETRRDGQPYEIVGIGMPGPYSSDHSVTDAEDLAERLGIPFHMLPIKTTYEAEKALLGDMLAGPGEKVADENIQARLRALHLMTLANSHNLITLNTGNKSEASVGYFTLGGDSSGGFAILKDVYKTRAYELALWRNEQATKIGVLPPIPENTITKPPSAELAPDQEDTDSLPPYPVLDDVLVRYLEKRESRTQIIKAVNAAHPGVDAATIVPRVIAMVTRSEHKRRQVAPGVKVTERAYGLDRRYPIVNGFIG